jgi:hypothetical protein
MPSPSSHNSLSPTGFSQGSPALQELGLKFSPAVFEVAEGDLVTPVQLAAAVVDAFPGLYSQMSQGSVELILEGEPPYDLFVRWKPLSQQAIGWHPDLNDGVRMNIRPSSAPPTSAKKAPASSAPNPTSNGKKTAAKNRSARRRNTPGSGKAPPSPATA